MTVAELMAELSAYDGDALVVATWEGTFREIEVTSNAHGAVILDVDEYYRGAYGVDGPL